MKVSLNKQEVFTLVQMLLNEESLGVEIWKNIYKKDKNKVFKEFSQKNKNKFLWFSSINVFERYICARYLCPPEFYYGEK